MAWLTWPRRHTEPARLGSQKPNPGILLTAQDRREQDLFPPLLAYNIFPARPFSALSNRTQGGDRLSSFRESIPHTVSFLLELPSSHL